MIRLRLLQLLALLLIFATTGGSATALCPPPPPGPPAASPPVSPAESPISPAPTFVWETAEGATWYYLWLDGPGGNVFTTWFKATNAVCDCDHCSVAPAISLDPGAHTWWVRTYNSDGYGPWSAAMNFTVTTDIPAAATLVSPAGIINTANPTYTWNAVSNATWYYLWVNDFTGTPIKTWYSAIQSGCASGTGTCSVTPSQAIYGPSQ
ncbi:MAG: hypothetical protein KAG66_22665, partial [Methylococcales bacterium]|nr:hypothetical protein [Methylococcales bacterium]